MSLVRDTQTSGPLEVYMVVNFRAGEINQSTRKLARASTIIIIIKKEISSIIEDNLLSKDEIKY
jgi:hypothetical protein